MDITVTHGLLRRGCAAGASIKQITQADLGVAYIVFFCGGAGIYFQFADAPAET
jgi:hypothetical protein